MDFSFQNWCEVWSSESEFNVAKSLANKPLDEQKPPQVQLYKSIAESLLLYHNACQKLSEIKGSWKCLEYLTPWRVII